jgi:predicted amidohydrolase YtcJ
MAWLPYRQLLDAGARVAFSSDEPVEDWQPLRAMDAGITRRTSIGTEFHPEQRVTAEEAIRLYTIEAAKADFTERERGSLEAGKRADLVVLSDDPLALAPEEFEKLQVLSTYVAGERVFGA